MRRRAPSPPGWRPAPPDPCRISKVSTRRDHAPQGVMGGGAALPGRQRLISADGAVRDLPGCFSVRVGPGDVIEIETPGGGGFGPSDAGA